MSPLQPYRIPNPKNTKTREMAQEVLDQAEEDLMFAISCLRKHRDSSPLNDICYLLNQSLEKWLKVAIQLGHDSFPKKHDLEDSLFPAASTYCPRLHEVIDILRRADPDLLDEHYPNRVRYREIEYSRLYAHSYILLDSVFETRRRVKTWIKNGSQKTMTFTLNCEILSPLFMSGANARGTPELRPPSFRGAMRFWYRALLGGSQLLQVSELHQKEGEVLGTTEKGSSVSLRLSTTEPAFETFQKDRAIRTAQGDYLPTGKDYLLWSMSSIGKPGTPRFQPARQFIKPGTKFQALFSTRNSPDALQKGIVAFWLLSNLGAVGARANRCGGAFQAVADGLPLTFKICDSISMLQTYLHDGLSDSLRVIKGTAKWATFPQNVLPEFDVLHPQFCSIWIVSAKTAWNSYQEALNGLGEALRDFRSHLHPIGKADHDEVLRWFDRKGKGPLLKRPIFGLPIPFRYSEGGPSDVVVSTVGDRRTSPLHIRITRLSNGQFVGVLVVFKSQFLPKYANLQLEERKWQAPAPSDHQVIEDFIQQSFAVRESVPL